MGVMTVLKHVRGPRWSSSKAGGVTCNTREEVEVGQVKLGGMIAVGE